MAVEKFIDYIDDPNDTYEEYLEKAKKYNFRCVFFNEGEPETYERGLEILKGTDIILAGAIDFPEGVMELEDKMKNFETMAKMGVPEIDYVLNQKAVESRDFEAIEKEMAAITEFCRKNNIEDKVIVEMCKLDGDDEAKRKVCEIALKVKPAYLKTSTGRSFKGADLNDVKLMKSILGDEVKIKAAGGIHNYEEAKAFINAGASVLGASAGIAIVEGEPK
ncbi:MAG: deoxyribose-phosphate aldolase [Eubacterium sp.]